MYKLPEKLVFRISQLYPTQLINTKLLVVQTLNKNTAISKADVSHFKSMAEGRQLILT